MLSDAELIDWLQLINTENIGPITFFKLLQTHGSAAAALEALPQKYKKFSRSLAEKELKKAQSNDIKIIDINDALYPQTLKSLEDAPPLLYVAGNAELLNSSLSLAVVGARNASINGRKTASRLAYELTNNQVLIISGMARGIDSAAHKGALYALDQQGPTIAVLGTGVDVIYPPENAQLFQQIKAQGAVISEFPLSTGPQPTNFPRRNRIVAGLALGTLVVEATEKSGSLITARLALENGRDIFAVPGAPYDQRAQGPNRLIKEGAALVENSEDILRQLLLGNTRKIKPLARPKEQDLFSAPIDISQKTVDIPQQSSATTNLTELLNYEGVYVDEIIRRSGLDPSSVSLALLELEMDGKIERQPGNKVTLIRTNRKNR